MLPMGSRVLYEVASLDAARLPVVTIDTSDITLMLAPRTIIEYTILLLPLNVL